MSENRRETGARVPKEDHRPSEIDGDLTKLAHASANRRAKAA